MPENGGDGGDATRSGNRGGPLVLALAADSSVSPHSPSAQLWLPFNINLV